MEKKQRIIQTDVSRLTGKPEKSLFYITEKMFGTRGSVHLRWPPRHILVFLQGEKEGKRVIPYVTALAKTCGSRVTVFTVGRAFHWSLATPSIPVPTTKAMESRLIPSVIQMRTAGIDVAFKILQGERNKIIEELAATKQVDLIILDNRYRHGCLRYLTRKGIIRLIDHLHIPTIVI